MNACLSLALCCLLLLTAAGRPLQALADAPPNILFIFADDHAYQAISAYGSRINQTPHIDRIAEAGMRFDRCLVTNSICGPSRAVILTGKYSHRNGFRKNGDRFDGSQPTFPKLLQQAGYQTAVIGKWHLASEPTGFDHWRVLPGQGHYYNPDMLTPQGKERVPGYVTDIITDAAVAWLNDTRDRSRPFMLMVQHKAPHREWEPGPAHLHTYDDVTIPEPKTLFDDYRGRASPAAKQQMTIARHLRDAMDLKLWDADAQRNGGYQRSLGRLSREQRLVWDAAYEPKNLALSNSRLVGKDLVRWKYQRYIKDYLRCVASIDDGVGRILDELEEQGLAQNTVVIYSSDQGFYLGEHGWYDKRWMYEESLRTPLLVRWPNVVRAATTCDEIVSNLDFAETFLDIASVDIPADMQGRSMLPILRGETPSDWRDSFYYHYYEGPTGPHAVARHRGVATDRYKLIHYYDDDEWELFDRETDPQEMTSVYNRSDYAQQQAALASELRRLRSELGVID